MLSLIKLSLEDRITFVIAKMTCRKMNIEASKQCKKLCFPAFTAKQPTTGRPSCSQAATPSASLFSSKVLNFQNPKMQNSNIQKSFVQKYAQWKILVPCCQFSSKRQIWAHILTEGEPQFEVLWAHILTEGEPQFEVLKPISQSFCKHYFLFSIFLHDFRWHCWLLRRFYDFGSFASHQLQCLAFDCDYSRSVQNCMMSIYLMNLNDTVFSKAWAQQYVFNYCHGFWHISPNKRAQQYVFDASTWPRPPISPWRWSQQESLLLLESLEI